MGDTYILRKGNATLSDLADAPAANGAGEASKVMSLDASGNFAMPDGGYLKTSQAVLASAGSGQSTYAQIADENVIVTGADGTKGAALPAAVAGLRITVVNDSVSAVLPVSPVNGGNDQINALTAGTGVFTLGPGVTAVFIATSATKWYVEDKAAETPTTAQINLLVQGVAAGYKIARSAAPISLDGSNPTSVAHGLTTCLAAFVQLIGSAAPGSSTSLLTCVINGANIDVYAWKPTGAALTDLVASGGTETFSLFAIGT